MISLCLSLHPYKMQCQLYSYTKPVLYCIDETDAGCMNLPAMCNRPWTDSLNCPLPTGYQIQADLSNIIQDSFPSLLFAEKTQSEWEESALKGTLLYGCSTSTLL